MGSSARVTGHPRVLTTRTVHAPASNMAAVVTLAADANYRHVVRTAHWSYNTTPAGGITIVGGGVTQLDLDLPLAGPGQLTFDWVFGLNEEVVVTLEAAGVGVTGKLAVAHYRVSA